MTARRPDRLVVVGASLAGLRAVEQARTLDFDGTITLVGDEVHLPYDRPPLSKHFIHGGDALPAPHLSSVSELADDLDVDLRLGAPATALDTAARCVGVGGDTVRYDALIIATGARARTLPGARQDMSGVHTLRTLDDALAIRAALDRGARTVVIGAGFIGSEVASSARRREQPVTILESLPTPLGRAVGERAGAALAGLHERYGATLRCGVTVAAIEGGEHVTGVRLADGTLLPADLVVVGIGAAPATRWLEGSGLQLDNGVVCDATLAASAGTRTSGTRTSGARAAGIWAAGDVARWLSPDFEELLRLEHWTNAADQGAHAAGNAIDPANAQPYRHIPYFWSDWYGQRIQFAGLPRGVPTLVSGAWGDERFVALYRAGDRLIGVLTLNRRADIMKYRALIARRASWQDALDLAATRNTPAR